MRQSSSAASGRHPFIEVIADLEKARCRALMENDLDAFSLLVADELVHVHTSGRVEGKSSYLDGVRN